MAKTRTRASLDAKKIIAGLSEFSDNPDLKYKPGWPAICALGRNHPEVAYKQFRDTKHGFVYDNRRSKDSDTPIAKLVQINSLSYDIYVKDKNVMTKQTVDECLRWIKLHVLGIV